MLAMRGIEVGAAVVIIAFGALLFTGYMVHGRDLTALFVTGLVALGAG